jgi:hypothetical protein
VQKGKNIKLKLLTIKAHKNYDINICVAMRQQAHQYLAHPGEPVQGNKSVRVFLAGITDPQCAPIK